FASQVFVEQLDQPLPGDATALAVGGGAFLSLGGGVRGLLTSHGVLRRRGEQTACSQAEQKRCRCLSANEVAFAVAAPVWQLHHGRVWGRTGPGREAAMTREVPKPKELVMTEAEQVPPPGPTVPEPPAGARRAAPRTVTVLEGSAEYEALLE